MKSGEMHILTIAAAEYPPVDASPIPTGRLVPVAGTAFDFRRPRAVADGIRDGRDPQIVVGRGYDHNFALEPQKFPDAPNRPGFASARVDPGNAYHHRMHYKLTVTR